MTATLIDFTGARAARQLESPLTWGEAVAGLKYAAKQGRALTLACDGTGHWWLTEQPVSVFDDPPLM
jgi:hypothetical protein